MKYFILFQFRYANNLYTCRYRTVGIPYLSGYVYLLYLIFTVFFDLNFYLTYQSKHSRYVHVYVEYVYLPATVRNSHTTIQLHAHRYLPYSLSTGGLNRRYRYVALAGDRLVPACSKCQPW